MSYGRCSASNRLYLLRTHYDINIKKRFAEGNGNDRLSLVYLLSNLGYLQVFNSTQTL